VVSGFIDAGRFFLRTFFPRKSMLSGLACIGVDPAAASYVRIVRKGDDNKPVLAACEAVNLPIEVGAAEATFRKWARAQRLDSTQCTTVLDASQYRLLTTDAPDVPQEELRAALRWKIKDLIDFPAQDATIDVFDLPGAQVGANGRPVYVVAARSEAIRQRVDILNKVKAKLAFIDIVEMSLRNIAGLLTEDAAGVAILSLSPQGGLITLTKQSKLYLSRSLKVGLEAMPQPTMRLAALDQMSLELQRSLDFFESHFRQPAIRHVYVMPQEAEIPGLLDVLHNSLGLKAAYIDFEQLLDCSLSLPDGWQARHGIAIGAALRQELAA